MLNDTPGSFPDPAVLRVLRAAAEVSDGEGRLSRSDLEAALRTTSAGGAGAVTLDQLLDAGLVVAEGEDDLRLALGVGGGSPDGHDAVLAAEAAEEVSPALTLGARGLVKIYRKRRVVNDVDLYLREGEIVGLLGPNGAGKTTTFYMLVGLIQPDEGRVFLEDEEISRVPMFRRARRGIGYLAQEPSVFRKLSVEENVLAILELRGFSRREQKERLEVLLDELGIKHLRNTKAYALSGGERRRLEITRALVGAPRFMLLDEPFAGVDPIAVHDIQVIVSGLKKRGIGVLISDHNVEQTLDIVDRAYIMYEGRVRVSGTVSELVWNDEVAEIYLGPTLTARMRQRYTNPAQGSTI
jgi:lipopolysaccharide export system ATP-binding protein